VLRFDADRHVYLWEADHGDRRPRRLLSVTQVLASVGLIDSTYFTEAARDRGTYVHQMLDLYARNDLAVESVPAEFAGYLAAYQRWLGEAHATPTSQEQRLADVLRGYAGTVDWIGLVGERLAIVEIKTGQPAPWHALQVSAYAVLARMTTGGRYPDRFGLYLSADGRYSMLPFTDRHDYARWDEALNLALWKTQHGY